MDREEKLEAIYKEMANKEVSFGCRCRINDEQEVIFIRQNKTWSYLSIRENEEFTVSLWYTPEIIWHPIMIGDVLDWIERKMGISNHEYEEFVINEVNMAVLLWGEYPKPIEEQSDECIDYVYSLIPSKSME